MNLYELTNNYKQLLFLLEESDEVAIKDTLDALGEAIEVKAENTAKVIKQLEADSDMLKNEIQRQQSRKRTIDNNISRLKAYLQESLESVGKDKIKGDIFTVAIQNNPPKLIVEDESEIPKAYWREQPPTLDRRLLLQDLKLEEYPDFKGARVVQERSLRIR